MIVRSFWNDISSIEFIIRSTIIWYQITVIDNLTKFHFKSLVIYCLVDSEMKDVTILSFGQLQFNC